jgi:hypothetical protein
MAWRYRDCACCKSNGPPVAGFFMTIALLQSSAGLIGR